MENIDNNKDRLLEEVMQQYGHELTRLAYTYVKDHETAKDMVQNVFIKCYEKLSFFRSEATVRTWLYRITVNQCKDYLKSWEVRKVKPFDWIKEVRYPNRPSAESDVVKQDRNQAIRDVILSLPTKYRVVIHLYYYEELTVEEMAITLDLSMNTVKTRIRRGRHKLKSMLSEVGVHG